MHLCLSLCWTLTSLWIGLLGGMASNEPLRQPPDGPDAPAPVATPACATRAPAPPEGRDPASDPGVLPAELVELAEAPISSVDELLDTLERADEDLATFQAQLRYDRRFVLQGDRHVREGELYFRTLADPDAAPGAPPRRAFAVMFHTLRIDDVLRRENSRWVFDGEWLIDRREDEKVYIARRIARPGERLDPLRLGEGPLPIPLGQKKQDILARYEVELLDAGAGLEPEGAADPGGPGPAELAESRAIGSFVDETYQLRLTPRPDRADQDEFQEIRLWYTRSSLLPRMARTVNRAGDISLVQLINMKKNQTLPEGATDIEPPPIEDGWDIQVDEGRFEDGAEGAR